MKKTWKTRMTALMFSASAVSMGLLMSGCANYQILYGPFQIDGPAESNAEQDSTKSKRAGGAAKQYDLDALTEDALLQMTDDEFIAFAQQLNARRRSNAEADDLIPAYLSSLPPFRKKYYMLAEKTAADSAEADSIAEQQYEKYSDGEGAEGYPQLVEIKEGFWRYYDLGPDCDGLLVADRAFYDAETMTLNAEVSEENVLLLAALFDYYDDYSIGAFVHDTGDALECVRYASYISYGDYGLCDTAYLVSAGFSVKKSTGKVSQNGREYVRTLEIPGTYHPSPGWD